MIGFKLVFISAIIYYTHAQTTPAVTTLTPTPPPTYPPPSSAPTTHHLAIEHKGELCGLNPNTPEYTQNSNITTDSDVANHIYRLTEYQINADNNYAVGYLMPSHVCSTMLNFNVFSQGPSCVVEYPLLTSTGSGGSLQFQHIDPILFDYTYVSTYKRFVDECMGLCFELFGLDNCLAVTTFNDLSAQYTDRRQYLHCTPVKRNVSITLACNGSVLESMIPYMATFTPNNRPSPAPTPAHPTHSPSRLMTGAPVMADTPTPPPTTPGPTPTPTAMPTPILRTSVKFEIENDFESEELYNRCASNDAPHVNLTSFKKELAREYTDHLMSAAILYMGVEKLDNHLPWISELSNATTITVCAQDDGLLHIGFEVDTIPATINEINLYDRHCTWNVNCSAIFPRFQVGKCYPPNDGDQLGLRAGAVVGQTDKTANYCAVPTYINGSLTATTFKKCGSCLKNIVYTGSDVMSIWHSAVMSLSLSQMDTIFMRHDNTTEVGNFINALNAATEIPANFLAESSSSSTLDTAETVGVVVGSVVGVAAVGSAVAWYGFGKTPPEVVEDGMSLMNFKSKS